MSSPRLIRFCAAIVLLALAPSPALAWGSEGHRIIAEIADQYLKPGTGRNVRDLLAIENATTLADIANWADQIRPQRPETAPWHYVDIPIHPLAGTPQGYEVARDCPDGDCVVAKIGQFESVLANRQAPRRQRLEALKFLVHFIGDIHQPLHCSDAADRGGNDVDVTYRGHRTNLHAAWDTYILAPAVVDERSYSVALTRSIKSDQLSAWRAGTAEDWANESYRIARTFIYGSMPHQRGPLPDWYGDKALPVVNEQLEKAGVRLAMVLNKALL